MIAPAPEIKPVLGIALSNNHIGLAFLLISPSLPGASIKHAIQMQIFRPRPSSQAAEDWDSVLARIQRNTSKFIAAHCTYDERHCVRPLVCIGEPPSSDRLWSALRHEQLIGVLRVAANKLADEDAMIIQWLAMANQLRRVLDIGARDFDYSWDGAVRAIDGLIDNMDGDGLQHELVAIAMAQAGFAIWREEVLAAREQAEMEDDIYD